SLMVALTLPAAAGLALVAKPLAAVMVGPALRDGAAQVTPWVAASAFLAGITVYYFHTAFTLARRTPLLMAAMTVPAVANLTLNLILVPRLGIPGALWATLISYGLGAVASWALGRSVLALPIPWATIVKAGIATLGMALAVRALPAYGGVVELILKAGTGAVTYAALALVLDVGGLRTQSPRLVLRLASALRARFA
ncbi:MAG: polysaccharide biosynthesis C-terminal domain-containing protein, partial [Caulobacteraceae bacterium]|nr:polysaccharide biosynthesis C-terminal domain-containing protein [Caulobacteraceae bacterium]